MDFFSLFFLFLCSTLHTSFFKKKKRGKCRYIFLLDAVWPVYTTHSTLSLVHSIDRFLSSCCCVGLSPSLSCTCIFHAGGSLRKPEHLILIEEMLNAKQIYSNIPNRPTDISFALRICCYTSSYRFQSSNV
jgi:hypothetical protein